jgi:hypothetical protein
MSERDYDAEMRLPTGKTCADCRHFNRCKAMYGAHVQRTQCDFHPSRFAPTTERSQSNG